MLFSAVNIGYMFFRPLALPLVSRWRDRTRGDPNPNPNPNPNPG